MTVHRNQHLVRILVTVLFLFTCLPALASHYCGIGKVEKLNAGVRLYLEELYTDIPIRRSDGTVDTQTSRQRIPYLDLCEGDVVDLGKLRHDWCTATAMAKGILGVEVEAYSQKPDSPLWKDSSFVAAKEPPSQRQHIKKK